MTSVSSQRGSALIISLVILTAITIGAVVAMQRSTLQVRMVGNMQHQQNVFNATLSDLSSLINHLRNIGTATSLLNEAVKAENIATGSTIEPFVTGNLTRPKLPKNIKTRSEEHTSELQSRPHLVCRLLLEKKKKKNK